MSIFGICKIPIDKIQEIQIGQNVNVSLSNGKSLEASISNVDNIIQNDIIDESPYYRVYIRFEPKIEVNDMLDTNVVGKILISSKPILKLIF